MYNKKYFNNLKVSSWGNVYKQKYFAVAFSQISTAYAQKYRGGKKYLEHKAF